MGKHTKGNGTTDNGAVFGVTPDNMGRGLKFDDPTGKYNVDLTGYVDNETVALTPEGKLKANIPQQNSGLDCAAIDALPEAVWKKGTTLLAKQDGKCVRLTALDSVFQEIGVGITADKTNSFTDEEYKVVVTVSNTGEGKNTLTNLNIVAPSNTSDFTIKDVSYVKNGVDDVTQVDQFTYDIKGISKGGTVKVSFTVVPNVLGNYQFTASVNPNSALDQDLGNNNATLIINARTKANPNYTPSVDCPLIIATELDHNTVLQQLITVTARDGSTYTSALPYARSNVFSARDTLRGLRIKLEGASTVVGYKKFAGGQNSNVVLPSRVSPSQALLADSFTSIDSDHDSAKVGTDGYVFHNGVLEITEDLTAFAFSCRPQGTNCKWQSYSVFATIPAIEKVITVTNVVGAVIEKHPTWMNSRKTDLRSLSGYSVNIIPRVANDESLVVEGVRDLNSRPVRLDKLIVHVKAGTAASLNYVSDNDYAVTHTQGKTTITNSRITVSADATSTDSVNTEYIQVIVE